MSVNNLDRIKIGLEQEETSEELMARLKPLIATKKIEIDKSDFGKLIKQST